MYAIKTDFEGANLKVISADETGAQIDVDLRDTVGDWFYWCFKVENAGGSTLTFTFPESARVGYYGAAVSHDFCNWHWQFKKGDYSGSTFSYTFKEGENEVYFAHSFLYRPERFLNFAKQNGLEVKTLCKSKKGRNIPYIDIGSGDRVILLTARHHACESSGSYVLEGVLSRMLSDRFFDDFRIICVPFVDFDGVCDGDQGKNRAPYDHNRDYEINKAAIYSATNKIRWLADTLKLEFAFDFHSPWHLGDINDCVFIPIKSYLLKEDIMRFSNLFEGENREGAFKHYALDDMMPDVGWNRADSPTVSNYLASKGAKLAFSLETPYFKAKNDPFSHKMALGCGENFAVALKRYIENN